jgi:hypothetical protein
VVALPERVVKSARGEAIVALSEAHAALTRARDACAKLGEAEMVADLDAIVEDVNDDVAHLLETREDAKAAAEAIAS